MSEIYKDKVKSIICWSAASFLALIWFIIAFVPFFFMVINSFKEQFEMLSKGVFTLPDSWYPANYFEVVFSDFWNYMLNSVIVVGISLVLLIFVSACASYPLARFRFKLNKPVFALIVACMAIPNHITLIPVFRMSTRIGIYDSIWALIGPYVVFAIPISVFILTNFMQEIPREIEESAEIDGCSRYRMFFSHILPLSKPGLSTLAIYNGVHLWNEFVFAYTLTQTEINRTLPLAIWKFQGRHAMNTPMIMAVLSLTVLPMILLFIIFQDKLVKGMTAGAIKG